MFKQTIEKYLEVKNILVWVKNNTGMGDLEGDYAPQCEYVIYAQKGNRKLNGRRDSNILRASRTGNGFHPTEKPVDLFEFLISKSSEVGDVVFDPFIGGGTTAIACKNTKRSYIGCELEEEYCKTADLRLSSTTNSLF